MVERIIEFSARNRFIVFLLVFGLATAGLWAMKNTPVDAIPDQSDTPVLIYTTWLRRPPELVEEQITATPTCTSCSRTAPTSIGPEAAFWST